MTDETTVEMMEIIKNLYRPKIKEELSFALGKDLVDRLTDEQVDVLWTLYCKANPLQQD